MRGNYLVASRSLLVADLVKWVAAQDSQFDLETGGRTLPKINVLITLSAVPCTSL